VTTWIVLRAAGIGAYVMLFLSVAWGLASTTSVLGKRVSKASATTIHQFTATCGLFLLALHLGGLLVDTFTPFSVADITIPMSSSFRPVAVTFGIVAMYLMVFVIVASWLRKPVGTTWWRRTHILAVPTFVLSMLHGVFAGTDSARPAMWWTYVATCLFVVFLLVVRGLTAGFRPARAARPAPVARPAAGVPAIPPSPTGDREQSTPEPAVA
jgi:DMSO/TMAO reductase YedYZ heme-binding membrane subunit